MSAQACAAFAERVAWRQLEAIRPGISRIARSFILLRGLSRLTAERLREVAVVMS